MEFEPEWGLLLPLPLAEEDCVKTAANQPRLVSGSSQAYWAMEGIFSEKKEGDTHRHQHPRYFYQKVGGDLFTMSQNGEGAAGQMLI